LNLSWPRKAVEKLELLKKWRELSIIIAKAAKEILGESLKAIYIVGSIAENMITVYSDIDIAIVVDNPNIKTSIPS